MPDASIWNSAKCLNPNIAQCIKEPNYFKSYCLFWNLIPKPFESCKHKIPPICKCLKPVLYSRRLLLFFRILLFLLNRMTIMSTEYNKIIIISKLWSYWDNMSLILFHGFILRRWWDTWLISVMKPAMPTNHTWAHSHISSLFHVHQICFTSKEAQSDFTPTPITPSVEIQLTLRTRWWTVQSETSITPSNAIKSWIY